MGAPFYQGRFHNEAASERARGRRVWRWLLTRRPAPWPQIHTEPGPPPPHEIKGGALRATMVNHATMLVQTEGVNVLTDPIWSERCSPVSFAGPRRHRPPGLRFEDLPPIHLVLLSHNHYDHLDLPTLRRLAAAHAPAIVTSLGNGPLLERAGLRHVHELDWWDSVPVPGQRSLTVTATPAHHFSGRTLRDRNRTLWCGLTLHGPSGSIFFAGDTGYAKHFTEIRERLGPPRLALLPIGAYEPQWFMRRVHLHPEDAVRAHVELGAGTSLGIHYGTFRLTDEGMDEPLNALALALAKAGISERVFLTPPHGVGLEIPQFPRARRTGT
ncbi:MAG TPA: MBL fold metallo-hydrolase [Gammaproteobacteria bacterium]|nr:MBL fold metallo-hydrolase [Gammaproteobacteria bacterium]